MEIAGRFLIVAIIFVAVCCSPSADRKFKLIESAHSGIKFRNDVKPTVDFNIFNYMYFYNGGGVAVGDVNGDGWQDIYFTANQGPNKLYLNKRSFKFEDITEASGAAGLAGWATGVTMADVNSDGKLDIYISYLGDYLIYQGRNQLLINEGNDANGLPKFADRSVEFGLDLVGFSTQAAFFDYDLDGDLDMYMLNHSLHQNGTFGKSNLRYQSHPLAGDKLLRNDGNRFTDVTKESGIYNSVIGYGLGIAISDVNLDGWPDIYVGNDFHENDYLYINQGDGAFKETLEKSMQHTSHFSMGCDFGDFNNDGFPDLISMDMLPNDPLILKASAAEDSYDIYSHKLGFGYNYQYARNTLQLNQHNGTFSEIGLFAGVQATDWSWSPLWADFDLDGYQDIFIANGIERRSNNLDYINFIAVDSVQMRIQHELKEREMEYYKKMPQIKIPNFLYLNNHDSTFTNKAMDWGLEKNSYSHGAAYADFDNDGDWDLVTNNAADEAFVCENLSITSKGNIGNGFIQVSLKGKRGNPFGLGTKVFLYNKGQVQMQECMATRGFQSAVDTRLIFGTGKETKIDSLVVVWPDKTYQVTKSVSSNSKIEFVNESASGLFDYSRFHQEKPLFQNEPKQAGIDFRHRENNFVEFNREALIPHMVSAEGPACAIADVNGDGLEDVFLGNGKWARSALYVQQKSGDFRSETNFFSEADTTYEDVDAAFFDANKDGDKDLMVVSGGNEWSGNSEYMQPRIFFNDGKGKFTIRKKIDVFLTGSVVRPIDFDKDGDIDVFIGARAIPWKYGIKPDSYLLLNNGKGDFSKAPESMVKPLTKLGFVKDAKWVDFDKDGDDDLIVAAEWNPITLLINDKNSLSLMEIAGTGLENTEGWWNAIEVQDFDNDGDSDFIVGNLGLNSKLKTNIQRPVKLVVNDFDKNGTIEQVLTHFIGDREYPFYTRDEMTKQLPYLKKKYLSYQIFAEATLQDFFTKEQLNESEILMAKIFQHVYVENKGDRKFIVKPLPQAAQFSTLNAIVTDDYNGDGKLDIIAAGNFYPVNIQMGRYDASPGLLMLGDGKGNFKEMPPYQSGISLTGQTRQIKNLLVGTKRLVIAAKNNDSILVLSFKEKK
jgi:enediyne biosynthesis protein E4